MVKNDEQSTATEETTETPPAPPEPPTAKDVANETAPVMIEGRIGDVVMRVELNESNELPAETEGQLLDRYRGANRMGEIVSVSVEMTPIARIEDDEHFETRVSKHAEHLNVRRTDLLTPVATRTNDGKREIIGRFVIVRGVA